MTVKFKKDYVTVIEKTEVDAELQEQIERNKIDHDRQEAATKALNDLKDSAKTKLMAGEPLTEEEANVMLGG
jgi:hypothetical protein